ncbi:MAG: DNA-formamidopyrimidine glycosylase [Candidatus Paceibacterota bacterium]|jgi:formamidopyrimidine-DNA glycosylase
MPELPEVETIVRGLKKEVLNRTFLNIWTDTLRLVKYPNFKDFKKNIIGRKILNIQRRGKNILFCLDKEYVLLIHQKMTGHLLVGKWKNNKSKWIAENRGPLFVDKINNYLHFIFFLDDGRQIALSDVRKFAKVELWKKEELINSKGFSSLGPEPLSDSFTLLKFKALFVKKIGEAKKVLMDQSFIAGIGNIYASEILWEARIHPKSRIEYLNEEDIKNLYKAIKKILKKGIKAGGASLSDFRDVYGNEGGFQKLAKVYQREGDLCLICGSKIKRIVIGQRGTFYCPKCQIKK